MNDYKQEIEQTRIGALGSSDAALVYHIAEVGFDNISDTERYRLAVLTGQAERVDYKTAAMALGDTIEGVIYDIIRKNYPQAKSNPLHEVPEMARFYGVGIINHIDVEVEEDSRVRWYEIKASKFDTNEVYAKYYAQLQWHYMMMDKITADGIDKKLYLVHYKTDVTEQFDAQNLTVQEVERDEEFISQFYAGLMILREKLPAFVYTKGEEMPIRIVDDERVQALRSAAETAIAKVKVLERQIADFKAALCEYMVANNIKKIVADDYSVTLTAASVAKTFDSKRFKAEHPDLYSDYCKQVERAASVTIREK